MTDTEIIEQFERTWSYLRSSTSDFLRAVPVEKWKFTHHRRYAPLAKQFSHMVRVYGVYIEGFRTGKIDFSQKPLHYSGPLDRDAIGAAFEVMDERLKEVLADLKERGLEGFHVDFLGIPMGFTEYTHVLIQHEALHMGIWSTYAAFGGFDVPQSWQTDWGF